tara:strand:- start:276 stop:461 length:186 start_codon:yes stop_codon:yes gene_type:complete
MNENQKAKLLSKKEVSQILSVSVRSVERLIARGILKKIKLGGCVRIRQSELENLIETGGAS